MIQRIQSVYLFIVALAGIFMFIYPFVSLVPNTQDADPSIYHMSSLKIEVLLNGAASVFMRLWPMVVLNTVVIAFSIFTLIQFKNRKTQISYTNFLMFLIIGEIVLIAYDVNNLNNAVGAGHSISFTVFTFLPILQIVFTRLATSAIKKDEALVRSADRLR
jgi:Domain of unknown function (DUF4293)